MRVAPDRVGIRFGSCSSQILMPRGRGPGVSPRLRLQPSIGPVASAVRGGAGPRIGFGFRYHSSPQGVKLGVSQGRPEVRLVERAGVISPLPHMPGRGVPGVEIGSVAAVCMLEGEEKRIGPCGNDDQVDVVGHEAIAGQREAMDGAVLAEKVQVDEAVGIGFEDDAAPIASLGDVVRSVESDDASETGHYNSKVWKTGESSQENVPSVPGFPVRGFGQDYGTLDIIKTNDVIYINGNAGGQVDPKTGKLVPGTYKPCN